MRATPELARLCSRTRPPSRGAGRVLPSPRRCLAAERRGVGRRMWDACARGSTAWNGRRDSAHAAGRSRHRASLVAGVLELFGRRTGATSSERRIRRLSAGQGDVDTQALRGLRRSLRSCGRHGRCAFRSAGARDRSDSDGRPWARGGTGRHHDAGTYGHRWRRSAASASPRPSAPLLGDLRRQTHRLGIAATRQRRWCSPGLAGRRRGQNRRRRGHRSRRARWWRRYRGRRARWRRRYRGRRDGGRGRRRLGDRGAVAYRRCEFGGGFEQLERARVGVRIRSCLGGSAKPAQSVLMLASRPKRSRRGER